MIHPLLFFFCYNKLTKHSSTITLSSLCRYQRERGAVHFGFDPCKNQLPLGILAKFTLSIVSQILANVVVQPHSLESIYPLDDLSYFDCIGIIRISTPHYPFIVVVQNPYINLGKPNNKSCCDILQLPKPVHFAPIPLLQSINPRNRIASSTLSAFHIPKTPVYREVQRPLPKFSKKSRLVSAMQPNDTTSTKSIHTLSTSLGQQKSRRA